jgi:hypothetical protein
MGFNFTGIITHMAPEILAVELDRDPFIPLRLRLANGRTLDITNPGLGFIARMGLYAFRAPPRGVGGRRAGCLR